MGLALCVNRGQPAKYPVAQRLVPSIQLMHGSSPPQRGFTGVEKTLRVVKGGHGFSQKKRINIPIYNTILLFKVVFFARGCFSISGFPMTTPCHEHDVGKP
jgi:hypothetical protein